MEDALVPASKLVNDYFAARLNPCFNGRCTRTNRYEGFGLSVNGLNPCFNGRCTRTIQII